MDIFKLYFEGNIFENIINLMPIVISFISMYLFTSQISLISQ